MSSIPTIGPRKTIMEIIGRIREFSDPVIATREMVALLVDERGLLHGHSGSVTIIAVGKAALHMTRGALEAVDGKLAVEGVVAAPEDMLSSDVGHEINSICTTAGLEVIGAQHPYPGPGSFRAGRRILEVIESCRGLCLFLLSGGASSLMEYPMEGLPEKDVIVLNRELVRSGASIRDINIVRKHISKIKGGRLAQVFNGTRMITLAVSDVMGSDPATIGSGPTVPDTPDSTMERCLRILEKYELFKYLSVEGRDFFMTRANELETPKSIQYREKFEYHIILSNELLIGKIKKEITGQYTSMTILEDDTFSIEGRNSFSVKELSAELLGVCKKYLSQNTDSRTDEIENCLLYITGGEPTVRVEGKGTGGRVQHLSLTFLHGLLKDRGLSYRIKDITLVAFATDGKDGNSPAAGCIADRELYHVFRERSGADTGFRDEKMLEEVERHLREFDSHSFFEKYDSTITTGPTGTNVMDVYMVYCQW